MTLRLELGDPVSVELVKDESRFGMPMPDEFAEVLRQDEDGKRLFDALSLGNQRLMLKLIVTAKEIDKQIVRSLAGIELLKAKDGQFNYQEQNHAMRTATMAADPLSHANEAD